MFEVLRLAAKLDEFSVDAILRLDIKEDDSKKRASAWLDYGFEPEMSVLSASANHVAERRGRREKRNIVKSKHRTFRGHFRPYGLTGDARISIFILFDSKEHLVSIGHQLAPISRLQSRQRISPLDGDPSPPYQLKRRPAYPLLGLRLRRRVNLLLHSLHICRL